MQEKLREYFLHLMDYLLYIQRKNECKIIYCFLELNKTFEKRKENK